MKPAGASPWPTSAWIAQHGGEHAADVDDEHHRVADLVARVELRERVDDRPPHDRRVEQRTGFVGCMVIVAESDIDHGHRVLDFARHRYIMQVLDDRPERQRRDERQRADEDHHADQQHDEQRRVRRQRAGARRHDLLLRQRAGDRQHRDRQPVAREEHRDAERGVVERRVRAQPGERAAVVVAGRREGVEDLAEAVRAGIGDRRPCRPSVTTATAVPTSTSERRDQDRPATPSSSRTPRSSCRGTPACGRPSARRRRPR